MDIINPPKANLYEETFPHTSAPRIDLEAMKLGHEVFITDTTFRDGQQARPPYEPSQILDIYRLLSKLDNGEGAIRQCEFFLYGENDREAVRLCLAEGLRYPEVTGWIRANPKDFEYVKEMGLKETGILTSCSDHHIYLKLGLDRKQAAEKYINIAAAAMSHGIVPRCHFEDVTRADVRGFVMPFAERLLELSEKSGVDVKIRACDTMGLGLPFAEAKLPRSVPRLIKALREVGFEPRQLEWHGHNDFHLALANPLSAWMSGCGGVNCTILGFGERTGNTPLEGMVIHYLGLNPGAKLDTLAITELADYLKRTGVEIPKNYPFVGDNFNTTSAGIHLDGLLKHPQIYTIFDTERLLGVKPGVQVTDKSGLAGIVHYVRTRMCGNPVAAAIDKDNPGIRRINEHIGAEYAGGRVTSISDDEMAELIKTYLPELVTSEFDKLEAKAKEVAVEILEDCTRRPDIQSMNPILLQRNMIEMEEKHPFIQAAFVTDADGFLVTIPATSKEFMELYRHFVPGTDCSDREWFQKPLRSGRPYVTGFYDSRITKALCITAATPVLRDGVIRGVLSIDLNFKELAKLI